LSHNLCRFLPKTFSIPSLPLLVSDKRTCVRQTTATIRGGKAILIHTSTDVRHAKILQLQGPALGHRTSPSLPLVDPKYKLYSQWNKSLSYLKNLRIEVGDKINQRLWDRHTNHIWSKEQQNEVQEFVRDCDSGPGSSNLKGVKVFTQRQNFRFFSCSTGTEHKKHQSLTPCVHRKQTLQCQYKYNYTLQMLQLFTEIFTIFGNVSKLVYIAERVRYTIIFQCRLKYFTPWFKLSMLHRRMKNNLIPA
jgi:hypothetical protein